MTNKHETFKIGAWALGLLKLLSGPLNKYNLKSFLRMIPSLLVIHNGVKAIKTKTTPKDNFAIKGSKIKMQRQK